VAKEGEKKRVEETLSFESLLSLFCFLPPALQLTFFFFPVAMMT